MSSQNTETSRLRGLMLVAGREIRVRGLSKANVISLIVTVLIVGVLAALPTILGGGDDEKEKVGLAGANAAAMEAQLDAMGGFDITTFDSAGEAEKAVEDGTVDAAVADGKLFSEESRGHGAPDPARLGLAGRDRPDQPLRRRAQRRRDRRGAHPADARDRDARRRRDATRSPATSPAWSSRS